jgi:hypothetical protein
MHESLLYLSFAVAAIGVAKDQAETISHTDDAKARLVSTKRVGSSTIMTSYSYDKTNNPEKVTTTQVSGGGSSPPVLVTPPPPGLPGTGPGPGDPREYELIDGVFHRSL